MRVLSGVYQAIGPRPEGHAGGESDHFDPVYFCNFRFHVQTCRSESISVIRNNPNRIAFSKGTAATDSFLGSVPYDSAIEYPLKAFHRGLPIYPYSGRYLVALNRQKDLQLRKKITYPLEGELYFLTIEH